MSENDLISKLIPIIKQLDKLVEESVPVLSTEVDRIIRTKCRDAMTVERLMDSLLDMAFYDEVLAIFKKLCRYWYYIDPESTAFYIMTYRDMYDNNESGDFDEGESKE